MTLPASGLITMSMVNTELNLSATAPISLNDAAVRTLFGKPGSGNLISMSDGHGKSNASFTITAGADVNIKGYLITPYAVGSCSPTTYSGHVIQECADEYVETYQGSGEWLFSSFMFMLGTQGLPQTLFNTLKVNGVTFASNSLNTFANSSDGRTYWLWTTPSNMAGGGTYPVSFT